MKRRFEGGMILGTDISEPTGQRKRSRLPAAAPLDYLVWFEESRQLPVSVVYTPEILTPLQGLEADRNPGETAKLSPIPRPDLSEEYLRTGGQVVQRRLVEAGFRPGPVLGEIP